MEGEKEEKISEETRVVNELPTQPVRVAMTEDEKTKVNFLTVEEAIGEILERIRSLDSKL